MGSDGIDAAIDAAFRPLAKALSEVVFFAVPVGEGGDAFRLLDHDLVVVLRPRWLGVPLRPQSRGPLHVQPDLLWIRGGGLHDEARGGSRFLRLADLRHGVGERIGLYLLANDD